MHALTIPFDMIRIGTRKGQRLERVANTIIFLIAINNNYNSHTDWYIIIYIQ